MSERTTTMERRPDGPSDDGTTALSVSLGSDGVVMVVGDIDAATAAEFDDALRTAGSACGEESDVVVDVGGVGFVDSSGLRALVAANTRARERNGRVRLRNPSADLARLLEITGLRDMFSDEF